MEDVRRNSRLFLSNKKIDFSEEIRVIYIEPLDVTIFAGGDGKQCNA